MPSLRETINRVCLKRLGRKPDLENPAGYNDLIQWLKIHDQRADHIIACDKWAVRDWVSRRAGPEILIPASLNWPPPFLPAIAKCSHDSGSARRIRSLGDAAKWLPYLSGRLHKPYGVEKGEWAYRFIKPKILVEQMLEPPVVDFKFHCSGGKIRWAQIISERDTGSPVETILGPDGECTGLHMDQNMRHDPIAKIFPGGAAWKRLCEIAEVLADSWRYVRVDLYWNQARPWFGELTFWPLAGCYTTSDEPIFGQLLKLDLSYQNPPIVA